jgi:uncharacterized protein (TIGR03643 family)
VSRAPGRAAETHHAVQSEQPATALSEAAISEIIEMALSDHISFAAITAQTGLSADAVQAIMRTQLKPGSYRAWRKRIRDFGTRRAQYK